MQVMVQNNLCNSQDSWLLYHRKKFRYGSCMNKNEYLKGLSSTFRWAVILFTRREAQVFHLFIMSRDLLVNMFKKLISKNQLQQIIVMQSRINHLHTSLRECIKMKTLHLVHDKVIIFHYLVTVVCPFRIFNQDSLYKLLCKMIMPCSQGKKKIRRVLKNDDNLFPNLHTPDLFLRDSSLQPQRQGKIGRAFYMIGHRNCVGRQSLRE